MESTHIRDTHRRRPPAPCRAQLPRAYVSVTVAQEDAEPLRRALFCSLYGHIKRLVVVRHPACGASDPTAALQIVLDRETVDEALRVVRANAHCTLPAQVRSYQVRSAGHERQSIESLREFDADIPRLTASR